MLDDVGDIFSRIRYLYMKQVNIWSEELSVGIRNDSDANIGLLLSSIHRGTLREINEKE